MASPVEQMLPIFHKLFRKTEKDEICLHVHDRAVKEKKWIDQHLAEYICKILNKSVS